MYRVLVYHLTPALKQKMKDSGVLTSFESIEMPALISLTHMELNGFGFSVEECEKQRKILQARLEELENQAYKLAKRTFSLTNYEEISRILYRELKLPLNGDKDLKLDSKFKPSCKPSCSKEVCYLQ